MKKIYKAGYMAKQQGKLLSDNPHSSLVYMRDFCAWAAGFSDCERGYELDLGQFDE